MKKLLLLLISALAIQSGFAATYYYKGSGSFTTTGNWTTLRNGTGSTPSNFTTGGDIFVIQSGQTGSISGTTNVGSNVTLQIEGVLNVGSGTLNILATGTLEIMSSGQTSAGVPSATPGAINNSGSAAININATGNFKINAGGTYTTTGSTAFASTILSGVENFAPTSNFVIGGTRTTGPATPTTGFGNLTYQGTGIMNCLGALNDAGASSGKAVQGNLTIAGTSLILTQNTALPSFTIGGDLIISSGQLSPGNGSVSPVVNIQGNFNMSGGILDAQNNAGTNCTINFTKSGTATFTKTGGTITAATASTRTFNFVVANGTTLDFGTSILNSLATSTVNFTVSSGGGLITKDAGGFSAGNAATGSIQNLAGSRIYSSGADYTFNRLAATQATGDFSTATTPTVNQVRNLTIDNTIAAGVTLSNTLTVTGTLFLTNGILRTGINTLTLGTAGTISGAGPTSYINGTLQKTFASGIAPTFTYPVGDAFAYAPMTLIANAGITSSAGGSHTVSTTKLDPGDKFPTLGSSISQVNRVHRYWLVTNSGLISTGSPDFNFGAQFNYPASEATGDPALYLAKYVDNFQDIYYDEIVTPTPTSTVTNTTGIFALGSIAYQKTNEFIIGEAGAPPCTDVSLSDVAANNSPICAASLTLLTATYNGTGAELTWLEFPGGPGTTGQIFHGTGSPSLPVGPGTYYAYLTGTCGGPLEQSVVVGLNNTNTFTGTANWSSTGNWSCGYAATSEQTVVIGNGGHATLDIDFTATGAFLLTPTSTLDIAPAKTLTVGDGVSADFGSQVVTFKSDAGGSGSFGPLGAGASISNDDNTVVERYIPATGRAWRLLSIPVTSSTKTIRDAWAAGRPPIATQAAAALEPPNDGTLITGDNFPNASAANAAGFDWWTVGSSSIRKYVISGSSGSWPSGNGGTPDINTKLDALDELGYMLFARGDRQLASTTGFGATTLRPNGSLKTGTKTVPVANAVTAKFKLIGNPYASSIDFEDLMANSGNSTAAFANHFWLWDAGNGTNGGFDLIHLVEPGVWEKIPTPFAGEGSIVENIQHVQSSQAIIIEATASGGTLTINEEDKSNPPGSLPSVFAADDRARFYTNLSYDSTGSSTGAGLKLADGTLAVFADGLSIGITDPVDIFKVYNFVENFGLLRGNEDLSLEGHPPITADDTLFFAFYGATTRNYALQFKSLNMQPGVTAFLQDNYLAKETAISTVDSVITTYNFAVTSDVESEASDRFRVVFKPGPLPLTLTSAKAYQQNNGVQVDWKTVNETGMHSYEVEKSTDGINFTKATTVAAQNGSSNNYGWFDAAPAQGNNYYRIKAINVDGGITYSQVMRISTLADQVSKFAIYPNPVKDGKMSIQFTNMEKGKYSLVVFNSAGQKVTSRDITHLGGNSTETINLGNAMASGVYRVSLIGKGGSVQNQTLVIQK